jgi:hypothetical protein
MESPRPDIEKVGRAEEARGYGISFLSNSTTWPLRQRMNPSPVFVARRSTSSKQVSISNRESSLHMPVARTHRCTPGPLFAGADRTAQLSFASGRRRPKRNAPG